MQDKYKRRYFATEMVGSMSLLALTQDDDQAHATVWEIRLAGFVIGHRFYPSVYGCAGKAKDWAEERFHRQKSKM